MLALQDGVSDIDLNVLLKFHKEHGKAITMTTYSAYEGQFGAVAADSNGLIENFMEKPKGDETWINGGFLFCEPKVFDYITEGDATVFERTPLENMAKHKELYAYKHHGYLRMYGYFTG